ncbi:asparagine synthetase B [bacterium]|nr:asparagine synthetase B [bacterium]
MMHAIGHRGKAERCTFVDEKAGIALGHVFCPTFRPANDNGRPTWYQDEDYTIALDGAIFNDDEFLSRAEGKPNGDRDTAAVAACFRENRSEFPDRLDGQFSLALWNRAEKTLCLVREAVGRKPLYYFYRADKSLLVFSSELKGILQHPVVARRMNRDALIVYLSFGRIPAPLTIFEGINRVYSGEVLQMDGWGKRKRRRYWRVPPYEPQIEDQEELIKTVREEFVHSVEKQIDGADRVGVFLSGGIDSTIILGTLKLLGIKDIFSFTIGLPESSNGAWTQDSDLYWANKVALRFGSRHRQLVFDNREKLADPHWQVYWQFDEPHIHSNRGYAIYLLSQAAKKTGVGICLSGQGADNVFGAGAWAKLRKMDSNGIQNRSAEELILDCCSTYFPFQEQKKFLAESPEHEPKMPAKLIKAYLDVVSANDIYNTTHGVLLTMCGIDGYRLVEDVVPCLNDVEVRSPYWDAKLIEMANRIPASMRGSRSKEMSKAVLKLAFKDVLPEGVVSRRKWGLIADYLSVGQAAQVQDLYFSPEALNRTGLFRAEGLQRIVSKEWKKTGDDSYRRIGRRTWALLSLQMWYEKYINGMDFSATEVVN